MLSKTVLKYRKKNHELLKKIFLYDTNFTFGDFVYVDSTDE